uniref:Submaxillary gland androgen regulated protein 3A n=1 Tax=Rattus norvegicus TaxID=10116 RepID=A0A8I6AGJ4_RAT
MKPLYLVFGLWVLIGCFLSGECHRGPRGHDPRRRPPPPPPPPPPPFAILLLDLLPQYKQIQYQLPISL